MTRIDQRDLLVLQMKRCIELLESSNLSKSVPMKGYGDSFYNIRNPETSELNKKLHEVRRDSIRLMKTIYSEGTY